MSTKRISIQLSGFGLLALALLAWGACTVNFNPSGQPCDSKGLCAKGYVCSAAKTCLPQGGSTGVFGSVGSSGASGSKGSSTSGRSSTGTTGTSSTTSTRGSTGTTGPSTCATKACGVGEQCHVVGGVATCQARTTSITCQSDSDCTLLNPNYICMLPLNGQPGFCSAECSPDSTDGGGCAMTDTCFELDNAQGLDGGLCLPASAPVWCADDARCSPSQLDCVYFGILNSAPDEFLPLSFCDTPPPGGGGVDAGCTHSSDCLEGNCINGTCLASCVMGLSTCPSGRTCQLADLENEVLCTLSAASTSGGATGSGSGTGGGIQPCGTDAQIGAVCSP